MLFFYNIFIYLDLSLQYFMISYRKHVHIFVLFWLLAAVLMVYLLVVVVVVIIAHSFFFYLNFE